MEITVCDFFVRWELSAIANLTNTMFRISGSRIIICVALIPCRHSTLLECGMLCLVEPRCNYFQAAYYNGSSCSLFAADGPCDQTDGSYVSNRPLWNNPYFRRFNKKG